MISAYYTFKTKYLTIFTATLTSFHSTNSALDFSNARCRTINTYFLLHIALQFALQLKHYHPLFITNTKIPSFHNFGMYFKIVFKFVYSSTYANIDKFSLLMP
jgi:hypothetical protein